jgi:hypothetical protein
VEVALKYVLDLGLSEFMLALLNELVHPSVRDKQTGSYNEQNRKSETQAAFGR